AVRKGRQEALRESLLQSPTNDSGGKRRCIDAAAGTRKCRRLHIGSAGAAARSCPEVPNHVKGASSYPKGQTQTTAACSHCPLRNAGAVFSELRDLRDAEQAQLYPVWTAPPPGGDRRSWGSWPIRPGPSFPLLGRQ